MGLTMPNSVRNNRVTRKKSILHHCPICALNSTSAMKVIKTGVLSGEAPYDLLISLKKLHFVPCDNDAKPITTPNKWRDSLHAHIVNCIDGDADAYDLLWQRRKLDRKLQEDLNQAAIAHGLAPEKDLVIKAFASADLPISDLVRLINSGELIDRDELMGILQRYIPTIVTQQLVIVDQRQKDYIQGYIDEVPIAEFKSIKEIVGMVKVIFGEYGVEQTVLDR